MIEFIPMERILGIPEGGIKTFFRRLLRRNETPDPTKVLLNVLDYSIGVHYQFMMGQDSRSAYLMGEKLPHERIAENRRAFLEDFLLDVGSHPREIRKSVLDNLIVISEPLVGKPYYLLSPKGILEQSIYAVVIPGIRETLTDAQPNNPEIKTT